MPKSEPTFLTATEWLEKKTNKQNLIEQVRLNIDLNREIHKVLDKGLSQYCQIIKIENSTLYLAAANQACAAKVRQLGPSIQRQLKQQHQLIDEIRIKIVASLNDHDDNVADSNHSGASQHVINNDTHQPSEAALKAFRELSHSLKSGPLASHVKQLLKQWEE